MGYILGLILLMLYYDDLHDDLVAQDLVNQLAQVTSTSTTRPDIEPGILIARDVGMYCTKDTCYYIATKLETNHLGEDCPEGGKDRICDGGPLFRSIDFRDVVLGFEAGSCRNDFVLQFLEGREGPFVNSWPDAYWGSTGSRRHSIIVDKLKTNRLVLLEDSVPFYIKIVKENTCEFTPPEWFNNE